MTLLHISLLINCESCTHGLQFFQSLCFSRRAAEAAGAGWRTGDVGPAAAALFQLDKRPAGEHMKGQRCREAEGHMIYKKIDCTKFSSSCSSYKQKSGVLGWLTWPHLSLLGQISGELGLDEVSDLPSWDNGQISADFWSLQTSRSLVSTAIQPFPIWKHRSGKHLQLRILNTDPRVCLSVGVSVLKWRRGKRPERRFTGLFRGDLADNAGGWRSQIIE